MNVASVLETAATAYGEQPVAIYRHRPTTYDEFRSEIERCAGLIEAHGVRPGDRVLLLAGNSPAWLVCYFAVMARAAVLVPVNPALTATEVAYIVDDCRPVLTFVAPELESSLAQSVFRPPSVRLPSRNGDSQHWTTALMAQDPIPGWIDVHPGHPSILFYTSGTTGRPKGAELSHAATQSTLQRTATWLGSSSQDRVLIVGSFAFIMHSTVAAAGHLALGATLLIEDRFRPGEALRSIESAAVTVIMWVPTMYVMALEWAENNPVDVSSLRVCISSGGTLPWALAERFERAFGKAIFNAWGMTEGTPVTGFDVIHEQRGRPGSVGMPLEGCAVRVVAADGKDVESGEVGELVFRSPSNMTGYLNRPEATAETLRDGWIWSGDLGWRDSEGYVYVSGRSKDMIIRGGVKIYPAEVEDTIAQLSGISECAVVGAPDHRFGEVVAAFVQLQTGADLSAEEILAHCAGRLASFKVPERVHIVHELPHGPTGKILKRELRDRVTTAR